MFDPSLWAWIGNLNPLHSYSTKKGRMQFLKPRTRLEKSIAEKWTHILLASFNLGGKRFDSLDDPIRKQVLYGTFIIALLP